MIILQVEVVGVIGLQKRVAQENESFIRKGIEGI
jgi:hypothetical protein